MKAPMRSIMDLLKYQNGFTSYHNRLDIIHISIRFSVRMLRRTIITGANRGIGFAIAENLAAKPGNELILACRDVEKTQKVKDHFLEKFPDCRIEVEELDLLKPETISRFSEKMAKNAQKIDSLINNAGIACNMGEKDLDVAKAVMQTNFYGPISLTEKILPGFSKNGKIIFAGGFVGKLDQIGSEELKKRFKSQSLSKDELSALMEQYLESFKQGSLKEKGWPKWVYTASKIGINHYAKVLAKSSEVKDHSLHVFSYCPGYVKTRMTGNKGKLNIQEGAITPVFLSELSPDECKPEQQGGFFEKCKISSLG